MHKLLIEFDGCFIALTNLLQKEDKDLLHAVTETHVVIKLCNDEKVDQNVWNALYDKAFAHDLSQTYEVFKVEIDTWRVRWSMIDRKPSRLQDTL